MGSEPEIGLPTNRADSGTRVAAAYDRALLMSLPMKMLAVIACLFAPLSAGAEPRNRHAGLLAEIEFGENSTRMPAASGSQLGQVAAWAHDNWDGLIVIDGHADARGPAAGSVRLSMRRARLVRDQLVALGVDPNQVIISAFGAEGRRHARVAVWGTQDTLESVIAKNKRARRLLLPQSKQRDGEKRHARPPRTKQRR
jgi:hypothetical protein